MSIRAIVQKKKTRAREQVRKVLTEDKLLSEYLLGKNSSKHHGKTWTGIKRTKWQISENTT